MLGQSSINTYQKRRQAGAPFAAGSANNGLSVDTVTGKIVLGNDTAGNLATLLSNRDIPLNGFLISLVDVPNSNLIQFGGTAIFVKDTSIAGVQSILSPGVLDVTDTRAGSGAQITFSSAFGIQYLNTPDEFYIGNSTADRRISLLRSAFISKFGAIDVTNIIYAEANGGGASQLFRIVSGAGADQRLLIDIPSKNYSLGDISAADNGTFIKVDDTARQFLINALNGLKITGDTTMIRTGTAWANGAGANAGTLLNSPLAGDPTKWIPVNDNGTVRHIPAW